MKKLIFVVLALFGVIAHGYCQPVYVQGDDVLSANGNKYWVSDADSVYFSGDTLYIHGADSLVIYCNTGKTLGMVTYLGSVTGFGDSSKVVFEAGIHKHIVPATAVRPGTETTFTALDSVDVDTSASDTYWFSPITNTTIGTNHTYFYAILIRGTAGDTGAIIIREERIRAF